MIEDLYPSDSWIHAYTDGSATNAVRDGGAGILICTPEGERREASLPTGKHCSNYAAEIRALMYAVDMIATTTSDCQQAALFTDARSVLEALKYDKVPELTKKLESLASFRKITLQWVPAHCGIPGNEAADKLAKEGAKAPQEDNAVSFNEKKRLIKAAFRNQPTKDAYHTLERCQQAIIFRLRTGHCRLRAHMFNKLRLTPTPFCECGDEETPAHVLQTCPRYDRLRSQIWPITTDFKTKLHGLRNDLLKTVSFIEKTGLAL